MSSTAIAVTAVAIAASAADDANRAVCAVKMENFVSKVATVAERIDYADCVHLLHPNPMSDDTINPLRVVVGLLLIGALVGCVSGVWKNWCYSDIIDKAIYGMIGAAAGASVVFVGMLAIFLIKAGIRFVL